MSKEIKAIIKDEVPEWHWWTRLPNIVVAKVDDPYELALLFRIRKVVGDAEDGVCYMSTRTLAGIAKMHFNTVCKKIHSLAEKGLIRAELKEAPRGWKVWHINLPRSLWEENEAAYRQLSVQTEPTVHQGLQDCTPRVTGTVHQECSTKNHITKNHIKKKRVAKYPSSSKKRSNEQLMLKSTPETRRRYLEGKYADHILS